MDTAVYEPAKQFAQDFLLVVENDFVAWQDLSSFAKTHEVADIADYVRDSFEKLFSDIADMVEDKFHELGSSLLRQLLLTWGIEPFWIIAQSVKESVSE